MSEILVAYFSATGTTANAAKRLAAAAGADLYEIKPAVPYQSKDLNWMNPFSRSTREMKGKLPYPELADHDADVAGHSTIFHGFPIWWHTAPTIINRFLESYDFTGKRIVLFATSGGSGFGKTVQKLHEGIIGDVELEEGRLLNGSISTAELSKWAAQLMKK